jgi:hypothetical protein
MYIVVVLYSVVFDLKEFRLSSFFLKNFVALLSCLIILFPSSSRRE